MLSEHWPTVDQLAENTHGDICPSVLLTPPGLYHMCSISSLQRLRLTVDYCCAAVITVCRCCGDETAVLWGEPRSHPPPPPPPSHLFHLCVCQYVSFQVFMHTHTHTHHHHHHQISLGVHTVHLTVFLSLMRSLPPCFRGTSV